MPIGSSSYWLKEVEKLNVLTVNHHMKSTLVSSVNKPQGKRMGFPNGSVAKNLPANAGTPLDQEDPLEEEVVTHCSILAG